MMLDTITAIYLSEWACGFYTGLAIGLLGMMLQHRKVKSLWGPGR